ncbi:MAG: TonB-dependent receptor plug domain-containing protein [Gemmatimonadaceae bacterium]
MGRSKLVRNILVGMVTATVTACSQGGQTVATGTTPGGVENSGKTLAQLFQGRPGVTVQQEGGGIRLRIRSAGDWDGRGDPLFVIDGLVTEPPNGVLLMNPNDIVGIEILKDDASTSMWGLKGANGVVKITTRRK